MVSLIEGRGTSEQVWQPFLASLGLPELPCVPVPQRVVVVAPHPDDEILAVGGLLTLLARAGASVEVVAVTDGEASHPGGSVAPAALSRIRAAETLAALEALGEPVEVRRLGLPDGGRDELELPVSQALRLQPGTWLVGPWEGDGHPDHEAVGRACKQSAVRDGARWLSYPVWAWHWATPDQSDLPWQRAAQVRLPEDVRSSKAAAIRAFASQTAPLGPLREDAAVLPPEVLDRFARPFEVVFT